jgi:hypothetical protein
VLVGVDTWTVLGALAAVVVVVPAFVAASFAVLAWRQGRETARAINERYEREIEPVPRVIGFDPQNATVLVSNVGGAARHVVVVLAYPTGTGAILIAGGAVPSHCPGINLKASVFARIALASRSHPAWPTLIAAKDMLGQWWDCNVGKRTDWATWWATASEAFGVPDIQAKESADGQMVSFERRPIES